MAGLMLAVCTDSSLAARKRLTLAPEAGEYSEADIEKEILFGREMAAIMLAERKMVTDERLTRYLNLVGLSIVRHARRPELNFHFAAIESSQINAYAAPGGYIFVTTAALNQMQNEAELAGVLAHEIAHITDRHIVEALRLRHSDESMIATVGKIVGASAESATAVFSQALQHALEILFSKGLQAESEHDADLQGLYLAAVAGYDPAAYLQYLQRVKPLVERGRGELDGTHPPLTERIERMLESIETEGLSGFGATKNEKRFRAHTIPGQ
jgi:predicted Zn-dependent protease